MRYFFFSYATLNGYGTICISSPIFPDQLFIREEVERQTGTNQIVVISLFEFRSREDFEQFQNLNR